MGCPHQGSQAAHLWKIMLNMASVFTKVKDRTLKDLDRCRDFLQEQSGRFTSIAHDFEMVLAYETYATPTALGRPLVVRTVLKFIFV
jgi:hypothetical protein